jgi:DNA-binding XRE family transcriptional regulator/tetratricopeptide (TPR) repeat protein
MTCSPLAVRRKVCGYTQEQFAAALMVATSTVRRWEKGTVTPQAWQQPRICRLLQISPDELAHILTDVGGMSGYGAHGHLQPGSPTEDVEVTPVNRRQFVGAASIAGVALSAPEAAAAGRRVGRGDVARFSARVRELRRLDDFQGGASVHPLAMAEIKKLTKLAAHATFSQQVGRELLSTLAELQQFASWTAFDAGRVEQAKKLAQAAATAANQAGNRMLAATALSELSYLIASGGDPSKSVEMAQASMSNAGTGVLPVVRVVLADRLAWAYARTGDAAGVDRAVGMVGDAHDRRDATVEEEPDTVYWINRDESRIMAGRCWAELRKPARAVPILETLTAPYDDTHAREMALYCGWLAGSYIDAGDIEAATTSARRAVELSHRTASPRTDATLRGTLRRFRPHAAHRDVRDLLASARF